MPIFPKRLAPLVLALTLIAGCGSSGTGGTGGAAGRGGPGGGSAGRTGGGGAGGEAAGSAGGGSRGGAGGAGGTGGAAGRGGTGGAGGRVACGAAVCELGQTCCNASCGICTPPGASCIQISCADAGIPMHDGGTCTAVPEQDAAACAGTAGLPPHFYRCVLSELPPPCVARTIGDVTNTYCCP